MPTVSPPSDAFPTAYNVALHAARDLTLARDERARVIDLFVQVLLIWPKRWNESVEREVAELALVCVHEAKTAEELVGLLQAHPSPATDRILLALMRRAYEGGHLRTLLVVMDMATHLFASEPEVEDRWIEAAIVEGLRTPKEWRGAQIALARDATMCCGIPSCAADFSDVSPHAFQSETRSCHSA